MPGRRPATGKVVSQFGPRIPPKAGASSMHRGQDVVGSGNFAPEVGVVTEFSYAGAYGYRVIFHGASGTVHWMAHCVKDSLRVSVGATVAGGTQLAVLGQSGNVTGPHVHWEVHPGGGPAIDPAAWLSGGAGRFAGGTGIEFQSSQETEEMLHYLCVLTSSNGMIGKDQRFVQGPDGVLRCLTDGEWPVIAHNFPSVSPAEWTGDMIVSLVARVGLREYVVDPAVPGNVGRLTGRIIYSRDESRDFPHVTAVGVPTVEQIAAAVSVHA